LRAVSLPDRGVRAGLSLTQRVVRPVADLATRIFLEGDLRMIIRGHRSPAQLEVQFKLHDTWQSEWAGLSSSVGWGLRQAEKSRIQEGALRSRPSRRPWLLAALPVCRRPLRWERIVPMRSSTRIRQRPGPFPSPLRFEELPMACFLTVLPDRKKWMCPLPSSRCPVLP
jgi:hypothetical protein